MKDELVEKIRIIEQQRAMLAAQFSHPATSKIMAMKLQGELSDLKTELKSLNRELNKILDAEELIELKRYLKLRWPNVWEDYLMIQKARTRIK